MADGQKRTHHVFSEYFFIGFPREVLDEVLAGSREESGQPPGQDFLPGELQLLLSRSVQVERRAGRRHACVRLFEDAPDAQASDATLHDDPRGRLENALPGAYCA
jgi:hypothetical protein